MSPKMISQWKTKQKHDKKYVSFIQLNQTVKLTLDKMSLNEITTTHIHNGTYTGFLELIMLQEYLVGISKGLTTFWIKF